jgi:serine/threonine protein phosphatase PrpC
MAAADTMPDYPGAPNAVGAVVSLEPGGRIEIAHVGDTAVWTWSATAGLRRWTVDQTAGQHVAHMLTNPGLTAAGRETLTEHGDQVVTALGDYVLTGLAYATVSTISWTPLRGEAARPDLVLIASDGVAKALTAGEITDLIAQHHADAQALADTLVHAAVTAPRADPEETPDNATTAIIMIERTA